MSTPKIPAQNPQVPAQNPLGAPPFSMTTGEMSGEFTQTHAVLPTIPPDVFARYEATEKGLGHKVIEMITTETAHRRTLQAEDMRSQIRIAEHPHLLKYRAQYFAGGTVLAGFALAFCLVFYCPTVPGITWLAGAIATGPVASIALAFILGKKAAAKDTRDDK